MDDEFDGFLGPEFSAVAFANSVLVATNNPNDNEIDFSSACKRLGFDLRNIARQMDAVAADNAPELLVQASRLAEADKSLRELDPSVKHLQITFNRLDTELLQPYAQAVDAYDTLKRLHATSLLLRDVIWFLHLAHEVETFCSTPETVLKAARAIRTLETHLAATPALQSVRLIRQFRSHLDTRRRNLIETAQASVQARFLPGLRPTPGQHSAAVQALCALFLVAPDRLLQTVRSFQETQVANALALISRSLTSSRYLVAALADVGSRAAAVVKFAEALEECSLVGMEGFTVEARKHTNLLAFVQQKLEIRSFVTVFWKDFATGLEKRLRDALIRGGAGARSLKSGGAAVREALVKAVVDGGGAARDGIEVRMVLNAAVALGT